MSTCGTDKAAIRRFPRGGAGFTPASPLQGRRVRARCLPRERCRIHRMAGVKPAPPFGKQAARGGASEGRVV